MTPLEAFTAMEEYYRRAFSPRVALLQKASSLEDMAQISKELLEVASNRTIGDVEAPEAKIDGHEGVCLADTVLGSNTPKTLGYGPYKRFTTCAKCLISLAAGDDGTRYSHLLERYSLPFSVATVEECKAEIQAVDEELFTANGVFAMAKQAAIAGEWRVWHASV